MVDQDEGTEPLVAVLPITHTAPQDNNALEIPASLKSHLGLDAEKSWVIVSEGNLFRWPGSDLRPVISGDVKSIVFGMVPPRFFKTIRDRFLGNLRTRQIDVVRRTE